MKTVIIRAHFLRQSRKKTGFPLQSFGCAKRISASIPCAPRAFCNFETSSEGIK
jgi:hypothetical protein